MLAGINCCLNFSYGYDRSCLKRAICDLSQHPFDDAQKNIIADVMEFLLT